MSARKPRSTGANGSKPAGTRSILSRKTPSADLERVLLCAYNQYQRLDDPRKNKAARLDFAFHMTDWLNDLDDLKALFDDPKRFAPEAAEQIVFGFLIHAVPHLKAAARLLLGETTDPFTEREHDSQPASEVSQRLPAPMKKT